MDLEADDRLVLGLNSSGHDHPSIAPHADPPKSPSSRASRGDARDPDTPRVAIAHLGCKLNQSEAEALSHAFAGAGFQIVRPDTSADIFILNTCTVTHVADRKSRQMLRRARRKNPRAQVIATGCYAHRAPAEIEAMTEVDLVVDNRDKTHLLEILDIDMTATPGPQQLQRVRSMVKIQEGCNQVCAYCIVPKTRGRERSLALDTILETVRSRIASGHREVILTGTQLGSYGYEFGPPPNGRTWYEELVHRTLNETSITRLRFSSLQPQEITWGMVDLYRSGRLCPHVHIPLQSGSNAVLAQMRRRYSAEEFRSCVDRIRVAIPEISITTDIIVGFPGESDEDFEDTARLAEDIGFSQIHVFPYSHRPGTSAAHFAGHVSPATKTAREKRLLDIGAKSAQAYREQFLGLTATVLWEEEKADQWSGLTEHYIRAFAVSYQNLRNRLTPVAVHAVSGSGIQVTIEGTVAGPDTTIPT